MNKAMLLIDMPLCCEMCLLNKATRYGNYCKILKYTTQVYGVRYYACPLIELNITNERYIESVIGDDYEFD